MTDYKSMFEQAVRTLAAIDEALGIGDDGCGDPEQTLDAIACLKASPISEEAMDILRAENEKLKTEVEEFAVLTSRLARQLKKAAPDNELPGKVADYLKRTGRQGSPLREVGAGRTATVTREMIGAAHDVMLTKGDFVLSANLLEKIYLAMRAREPLADREQCEHDALRYRKLRSCERFAIDEKCADGHWEPIGYEQLDETLDKEIENEH